jgi:hypothetical protein
VLQIAFETFERTVAVREFRRQISVGKDLTPDQYYSFQVVVEPVFFTLK